MNPNDSEELISLLEGLDRFIRWLEMSTRVCLVGVAVTLVTWVATEFTLLWAVMAGVCALAALASDWVAGIAYERWEEICPCEACVAKRTIREYLDELDDD